VWGALDGLVTPSPPKIDVYAFGCVAFETLTGRMLFESDSEMSQIALHVAHDGLPPALEALGKHAHLAPLVELLFSTLRRNPADRPSAAAVRKELVRVTPQLAGLPWPIDAA
jgi:serine/threonine protein kinase